MYVHIALLVVISFLLECGNCNEERLMQSQWMNGTVTVKRKGFVTFHTYSSDPSTGIEVDSHIIELPTKLIIYDAQFQLPSARELLAYARQLRKPIERIYISHSHPDHWYGLDVLKNASARIYALNGTIQEIKTNGQSMINSNKPMFQDNIPNTPTVPDSIVKEDSYETIDGVLFEFRNLPKTESDNTLVILLPVQKTALVGDFMFNKVHLFLGGNNIDNWLNTLKFLQSEAGNLVDLVLLGHTMPADANATLQENINYLETAKRVLRTSQNFNSFKSEMVRLFPSFSGDMVLDLAKKALFPNETL